MKHDIEKLKSKLIPLYTSLREDCNEDADICPFLMQWGDKFPIARNEGIIFYGRATNGWFGTWNYDIFFSNDDEERGWKRDDQMVWAEKQWLFSEDSYLTRKSQFWCVIKGVSTRFYGDEWYRYVAWSNICKAAPKSRGNPRDPLFYRTLENNIKIFRTELDFWSPKYIVLLTEGIRRDYKTEIYWASDFISSLNNGNIPPVFYEIAWDDEYPSIKIKVYKLGERYIILSLHPRGRKIVPHADAIIDTIERIEQQK